MIEIRISVVLGVMAGLVQLLGYVVYNKRCAEKINTGSWSIWAIGGIVDFVAYFVLTEGDWVVDFLPAVCGLAAISTFFYALVKKRFSRPDKTDMAFVGADGVITVIWFFTNVVVASFLYQVSTILSFIPMYRGQLAGKEKENTLPWLIWALAYTLLTASVSLRTGGWQELMYPVTHVIVHLLVVLFCLVKKQNRGPRACSRGPFCLCANFSYS